MLPIAVRGGAPGALRQALLGTGCQNELPPAKGLSVVEFDGPAPPIQLDHPAAGDKPEVVAIVSLRRVYRKLVL